MNSTFPFSFYIFSITNVFGKLTIIISLLGQIAPVAVSDAAMLAPEEVFSGKGDIKEEAELTQAERKRRRANKKRKYKGKLGQHKLDYPLMGQNVHPFDPFRSDDCFCSTQIE